MKTLIISAKEDAGVLIDGASNGAEKLGKYLESLNNKVYYINNSENFIKDRNILNKRKNEEEINLFNEKLYNLIINEADKFSLTIGGDHSISIASALANQYKYENIGIIWFDAHPDYNTFKTTITGNIHGLPLAVINNYEKELSSFHHRNYIKKENTVIVGARAFDKEEINNLKDAGIKVFTKDDIKKLGIENVINEALKIAGNNTKGIHISYDLDVIDPNIAKGVSVPENDGINLEVAYKALDYLTKDIDKITSFDLVEYNSLRDQNDETYKIATHILDIVLEKISNKK